MNSRHRTLLVVRTFYSEPFDHKTAWACMRLRDILLSIFGRPGAGERFLLFRISIPWFPLVIFWVVNSCLGAIRNTKEIWSPLAQEPLIKTVTQGALAFSYRAL